MYTHHKLHEVEMYACSTAPVLEEDRNRLKLGTTEWLSMDGVERKYGEGCRMTNGTRELKSFVSIHHNNVLPTG